LLVGRVIEAHAAGAGDLTPTRRQPARRIRQAIVARAAVQLRLGADRISKIGSGRYYRRLVRSGLGRRWCGRVR
jgi:hypothetical protein